MKLSVPKIFQTVLFIFLIFYHFSCAQKSNLEIRPIKILFLGESTTVGQGSGSTNENYVTKTISYFKKIGFLVEYRVIAKGGMSSSWGITKINSIVEYRPDIIILEFLINDQTLSLEVIKENYEIFSKFPYGKIVLFEIYDTNLFRKYRNRPSENPYILAHKTERWTKQIDTINRVPPNWNEYLVDGTHPSDIGYTILANILISELSPLFNEILVLKLLE
jgi:acyl-CoA thioesterase I